MSKTSVTERNGYNSESRAIFNLSPFPMLVFETESHNIIRANPIAAQKYGYTTEEFTSLKITDLFTPLDKFKYIHWLNDNSPSKEAIWNHTRKNGQYFYAKLVGEVFYEEDIELVALLIRDISEEIKQKAEIRTHEKILTAISDINSVLINNTDLESALEQSFDIIGHTLQVDRVYFLENQPFDQISNWSASKTVEWRYKLIPSISLEKIQYYQVPRFANTLHKGKKIVTTVSELIDSDIKKFLESEGIKSILILPVFLKSKFYGIVCIDDCGIERSWKDSDLNFLDTFVESISRIIEIKNTFKELQHQENKFKSLVQEGLDLIAVIDTDGNYLYVTPTSISGLGYEPEQFYSQNVFDYIHPEDLKMIKNSLSECIHKKTVTVSPYRFKDAKGNWRWLETKLTNLLNDPAVGGILTTSHDVTKDIMHAEELKMANERYRLASLATQDHIYDWNLKTGEVMRTGESLSKIFGYPKDAKIDSDFWKAHLHPDEVEHCYEDLQNKLNDKKSKKCFQQYRLKRGDGTYAYVMDSGYIVRNEKGIAVRLIGAVRDISEEIREKEEEQLILSLSSCIGHPGSLEIRLYAALEILLQLPEIEACEAWITSIDNSQINMVSYAIKEEKNIRFYQNSNNISSFKYGEGLPGHVWEIKKTKLWRNIHENAKFIRKTSAAMTGLTTALGVPIIYNDQFLGAFLLLSKSNNEIQQLENLLSNVGSQIGAVLKHKITEDIFNNFFHISSDLLSIIGYDGRFKKVNSTFYKLLGYKEDELINTRVKDIIHPEDLHTFQEMLEASIEKNTDYQREIRVLSKDKKVLWFHSTSQVKKEERVIFNVGKDITAQKEVEINLRQANEKIKKAQEIAQLGYWSRKLDENIAEWTKETYQIYGFHPGEFVPSRENITATFHPADRHLLEKVPDADYDFQNRIITRDNKVKWVHQHINVKKDKDGKPYLVEGTVQDITKQKEYEEDLRISKERFELAMRATNEIIWDWDHKTGHIQRSPTYAKILGYQLEEAMQSMENSWYAIIHREDKDEVWNSINQAMQDENQTYWQQEYRILTLKKEVTYVVDRGFIIRDEQGNPIRSVGAILDVTESRKYLSEIKKQNNALKSIAWIQSHRTRAPLARIMGLVNLIKMEKNNPENLAQLLDHMIQSAHDMDDVIRKILKKTNL
ncbi:PAS domain-containing protein [Fulvivirga maritima]|uniref:PAS domain-containing protein n=1 Tax=Fulvivirga maritima TaxID=2904247 RepID=UPI001F244104|nr:PAS domain-containing protein [Fulvivirga maritima]UII25014.1 PAS domain-containing protein [Fulvivirga maritima]